MQKIIVDVGYNAEKIAFADKKIINADVQVIKRNGKHAFVVLPKR